jgi:hypothetical protein
MIFIGERRRKTGDQLVENEGKEREGYAKEYA